MTEILVFDRTESRKRLIQKAVDEERYMDAFILYRKALDCGELTPDQYISYAMLLSDCGYPDSAFDLLLCGATDNDPDKTVISQAVAYAPSQNIAMKLLVGLILELSDEIGDEMKMFLADRYEALNYFSEQDDEDSYPELTLLSSIDEDKVALSLLDISFAKEPTQPVEELMAYIRQRANGEIDDNVIEVICLTAIQLSSRCPEAALTMVRQILDIMPENLYSRATLVCIFRNIGDEARYTDALKACYTTLKTLDDTVLKNTDFASSSIDLLCRYASLGANELAETLSNDDNCLNTFTLSALCAVKLYYMDYSTAHKLASKLNALAPENPFFEAMSALCEILQDNPDIEFGKTVRSPYSPELEKALFKAKSFKKYFNGERTYSVYALVLKQKPKHRFKVFERMYSLNPQKALRLASRLMLCVDIEDCVKKDILYSCLATVKEGVFTAMINDWRFSVHMTDAAANLGIMYAFYERAYEFPAVNHSDVYTKANKLIARYVQAYGNQLSPKQCSALAAAIAFYTIPELTDEILCDVYRVSYESLAKARELLDFSTD